jgi:hypothetical protein
VTQNPDEFSALLKRRKVKEEFILYIHACSGNDTGFGVRQDRPAFQS